MAGAPGNCPFERIAHDRVMTADRHYPAELTCPDEMFSINAEALGTTFRHPIAAQS